MLTVFLESSRCGDDLVNLFSSTMVQTFLNGETMRSCSSKEIYKHGTLRKVHTNACSTHMSVYMSIKSKCTLCVDWLSCVLSDCIPQCSTSAIKLKDVKIQLCSGCISISEATNFSCLFSTHEIDYNTSVLQCNAVESDDGQLINVGTFVQLKLQRTTSNEVSFVSLNTQLMFCSLDRCRTAGGKF